MLYVIHLACNGSDLFSDEVHLFSDWPKHSYHCTWPFTSQCQGNVFTNECTVLEQLNVPIDSLLKYVSIFVNIILNITFIFKFVVIMWLLSCCCVGYIVYYNIVVYCLNFTSQLLPQDLAQWLGVPIHSLFNFHPSVRPCQLELHIQVKKLGKEEIMWSVSKHIA